MGSLTSPAEWTPTYRVAIDNGIVVLAGELDLEARGALEASARSVASVGSVVLDFTEVTFIDSSCLSVIALLAAEGTTPVLRHVPHHIDALLEYTGLHARVISER